MPTYKNIRIPKRGGGSRLQRVQVLASGKYKFVKNLKKAASKAKKSLKKSTKRRSTSKSKGSKNVGNKKGFFGNLGMTGMVEDALIGYIGNSFFSARGYGSAALPITRVLQGAAGHALNRRGKARLVYGIIDLIDVWLGGASIGVLDELKQLVKIG